ncbi:MAG: hypothetical protein IPG39_13770 [Bacteroidetes bacterium]|nr:hypothetical protein [Bacteroidota bacterium]
MHSERIIHGRYPALTMVRSILAETPIQTNAPVKEKIRKSTNCCLETG